MEYPRHFMTRMLPEKRRVTVASGAVPSGKRRKREP